MMHFSYLVAYCWLTLAGHGLYALPVLAVGILHLLLAIWFRIVQRAVDA